MITVVVAVTLDWPDIQKGSATREVVDRLNDLTNKLAQDVRVFTHTPHDIASMLNRHALKDDEES